MRSVPTILVTTLLLVIGLAIRADGAPPENADGRLAPWFNGLRQPGTGHSCCSIADCRPVSPRLGANGYEVLISPPDFPVQESRWVTVPNDKILQGMENPLGRPVACWTPSKGVICFVRDAEI